MDKVFECYQDIHIGDIVEVRFASSNIAPVLGIITCVGQDSAALVYFPKTGASVARYAGAWNINDPRAYDKNGNTSDLGANRCLFKVIRSPMSQIEMARRIDELEQAVAKLEGDIKGVKSGQRLAARVEQPVENTNNRSQGGQGEKLQQRS